MSDEQRVRTMAGWIGVEISRSRVRTPGKAGYGLYRVRGSAGMCWSDARQFPRSERTEDGHGRRFAWTEYAFTLEEIQAEVEMAIETGIPAGPADLTLRPADGSDLVPVTTRWTSAYRGRRDLGVRVAEVAEVVALKPEWAAEVSVLMSLVDAGLREIKHVEGCPCDEVGGTWAACLEASMSPEQRQRAQNAAFQADHLRRRKYGLKQRHASKLSSARQDVD